MLNSRQQWISWASAVFASRNCSANSVEFHTQLNILCMKSKQTDSNVTVQDQTIQMNPTFQSNRTFTRPNGTKFTHDIWIKMVDWMTFILDTLFCSCSCFFSHCIMSFHVSWQFVWIPYFFSSPLLFISFNFDIERLQKVLNTQNPTTSTGNGKQRVSVIARHTVFFIVTVIVINHILPYLDRLCSCMSGKPHILFVNNLLSQLVSYLSHFSLSQFVFVRVCVCVMYKHVRCAL